MDKRRHTRTFFFFLLSNEPDLQINRLSFGTRLCVRAQNSASLWTSKLSGDFFYSTSSLLWAPPHMQFLWFATPAASWKVLLRDFFFFWGSPDGFSPNKHTMAAHMQCVCVSLVTIDDAWKASQIFRSDSLVVSQVRRLCDSQNQKVFNLHSQFLRSLTHARTSFPIDRNDIIISPQSTKSLHFYRTLLASLHGSDALFAWLDRQWTQKANTRNQSTLLRLQVCDWSRVLFNLISHSSQ